MFISHRISVLTWPVVHVSHYDYASTNERSYLMINPSTAGRHSSMCEQRHRRKWMKAARAPFHGGDAPQGTVPIIHRTNSPSTAEAFTQSKICRFAGQHLLRQELSASGRSLLQP